MDQKYNIVCLSNQFFNSELKTNKWYAMTRAARRGHNVVFVDPPTRFKALKEVFGRKLDLKRILTGVSNPYQNISLFTPANIFSFNPFTFFNTWFHLSTIKRLLGKLEKRPVILWVYHFDFPDLENVIKNLNHDILIYDCVDEYTAFPEYAQKKFMNKGIVHFIKNFDENLKIAVNQKGVFGKEWVIKRESFLA